MLLWLQSLLLVLALSLDAFVAAIAYGANNIVIPVSSIIIINAVGSGFLALSIFLGSWIKNFVPGNWCTLLSFTILMSLGIFYLFEGLVKNLLSKTPHAQKQMNFKVLDLKIVLDIYLDETRADLDDSHHLSSKEALYLATALSLDSLAVGFGSSLGNVHYLHYVQVISLSWAFGMLAVVAGLGLGKSITKMTRVDLSWISGLFLVILAFLRLL